MFTAVLHLLRQTEIPLKVKLFSHSHFRFQHLGCHDCSLKGLQMFSAGDLSGWQMGQ